jgi:uroporphyrinogen-III synthase
VAALKELGLTAAVTVREPNTWREVLATLDGSVDLRGKRIVVQEYGNPNPELVSGLQQRGAAVTTIPIYRWALPEDLGPLRQGIEKILRGEADVGLFTNGAQVDHLFRVAAEDKAEERLRLASKNIVIASVGPVCTEVLEQFGLKPDIEPVHPKMGALFAEVAARARSILATKRS